MTAAAKPPRRGRRRTSSEPRRPVEATPEAERRAARWMLAAVLCTLVGLLLVGTGPAPGTEPEGLQLAIQPLGAALTLLGMVGLMAAIHRSGRLGPERPRPQR